MVFAAFESYYYSPRQIYFTAWDPELEHRSIRDALAEEIVDIHEAADKFAPNEGVRLKLDELITKEVYHHLVAEKLDYHFLDRHGFVVIKDSSHRVVYHCDHPELIIKMATKPQRALPMEGNIKREREPRESVWIPLQNTNLLRAAGREYFINNLSQDLTEAFHFPEEFLYQTPHAVQTDPEHLRFFSVALRGESFDGDQSLDLIKSWPVKTQEEVAQLIIDWVKCSRFHDWNGHNLLIGKGPLQGRFVVIDCEPIGILIDKGDKNPSLLCKEEHILLGLINFRDNYCRRNGLWVMAEVAEEAIAGYLETHPDVKSRTHNLGLCGDPLPLSCWEKVQCIALIIASIVIPLIPLFFFLNACFSVYWDARTREKEQSSCDLFAIRV